jgi:hypothetical protein
LLGQWGIQKDSPAGRRVFRQHLERRRQEDLDKAFQPMERGWFLTTNGTGFEVLTLLLQPRLTESTNEQWRGKPSGRTPAFFLIFASLV